MESAKQRVGFALAQLETWQQDVCAAERLRDMQVQHAREAGASWTDIGKVLGISKQAAWEKYRGDS